MATSNAAMRMMGKARPIAARLALGAFDVVCLVAMALIALPATAQPAYAYVDPSVMTYTIQALAGVAVALSAVAGVAFRRSRRALMRAFNIDENARKEKDAVWARVEASPDNLTRDAASFGLGGAAAAPSQAPAGPSPKRSSGFGADALSWPKRLGLAFLGSAFLVFTVLFVAPCEVISGSEGSLVVGLGDVWQTLLLACLAASVGLALVLSILRGRVFTIAFVVVCTVGLCCYVQALFLNGGMPLADGSNLNWEDYRTKALMTLVVWVTIISVAVGLTVRFGKPARLAATAVATALVVVQAVGVGSLFVSYASARAEVPIPPSDMIVTQDGLFTVSEKDNVIVFVLDTYDTQDLIAVTDPLKYPDMLDAFTGFTWYQNCTGSLIPTRYGVPFLLSGVTPDPSQKWAEFTRGRYENSSFLADMNDLGYSVGIYSDSIAFTDMDPSKAWPLVGENVMNIEQKSAASLNQMGIIKAAVKIGFYRDLSWSMKPFFRYTTDNINELTVRSSETEIQDHLAYVMDDPGYHTKLKSNLLTTVDDSENGAFRFIHLNGVHVPYILDVNGNDVGADKSSLEYQAVGSMKIVEEYLRQLKQIGKYDDATIIITADHGNWYFTDHPLEYPSCPYMLVKPGHQTAEEAAAPVKVSDAPVTHGDFLPTVIKAMGGGEELGYGPSIEEIPQGDRDRYYYMTTTYEVSDDDILQYKIEGDVLDINNWKLTGVKWENVWGAHPDEPKG